MAFLDRSLAVEPLQADDLVAVAQCIVLDADAFPYASAAFGLRDGAARVWVARGGSHPQGDGRGREHVLGFVAAHIRRGVLRIEGLAVDQVARRRGIGRLLVREVLACARDDGAAKVTLHVSVANRAAIALYRAEGFVVGARLRNFYPPAAFHGEADAYEMVLRVGAA